jgi:hypothetical protein
MYLGRAIKPDRKAGVGWKVVKRLAEGVYENWDCRVIRGVRYPVGKWIKDDEGWIEDMST